MSFIPLGLTLHHLFKGFPFLFLQISPMRLFTSETDPPVGRDHVALHLLLSDDVPDTGQPVGQQEESHHQEDEDEAAVLGVPGANHQL